jgi:hypothetical protein
MATLRPMNIALRRAQDVPPHAQSSPDHDAQVGELGEGCLFNSLLGTDHPRTGDGGRASGAPRERIEVLGTQNGASRPLPCVRGLTDNERNEPTRRQSIRRSKCRTTVP